MKNRNFLLVLLICVVVAAWIRIWNIDKQGLWLDEAMFVEAATAPDLHGTITYMGDLDVHPPLFSILLRYWIVLVGDSDFAVRLLPALLGVSLIPLTMILAFMLTGRKDSAFLAGVVIAFNGYHIYLSQECRHYTWLAVLGTVIIIIFLRFMKSGDTKLWFALTVSISLGLLSHYSMFLFMLGVGIVALIRGRRLAILSALATAGALFLLTWGRPLVDQIERRSRWGEGIIDPLSGPGEILSIIANNLAITLRDFSGKYFILAGQPGFDLPDVFKAAAMLSFVVLALLGFWKLAKRHDESAISPVNVFICLGAVPIVGVIALGFHQANVYDTKYVSFVSPLWAVLVAYGATTVIGRRTGKLAVGLAGAALLVSVARFHDEAIPWKEDWRETASLLGNQWRSSDLLLQRADYMGYCLERYLSFVPERIVSGVSFLPDEAVADSVAGEFAASGKERLWVVLSHDEYGSTMLDLLALRLERGPTWTPEGGIIVTRFALPSNDSVSPGEGRHPPTAVGPYIGKTWLGFDEVRDEVWEIDEAPDEAPDEVFRNREGKDFGGEEENIEHPSSSLDYAVTSRTFNIEHRSVESYEPS